MDIEKSGNGPDVLTAVTVGTFDGVHLGHRMVLASLREEAAKRGLEPLAVTFDRHPLEIVAPERAPGLITGADTRDALLKSCGVMVERVVFNSDVRGMTAGEWMRRLRDMHGARFIMFGYDNTFGCDGASMSATDLMSVAEGLGLEAAVAPTVEGCSSSAVRGAVGRGDMESAMRMLGRPFSLEGTVVHGRHLGRTIGVPTANLRVSPRMLLPLAGVYAAVAETPEGRTLRAVVNVGSCPTVTDGADMSVEAHLLDYSGDLYGRRLTVRFLERLRDERKFTGIEELTACIRRDIERTRSKNLAGCHRD